MLLLLLIYYYLVKEKKNKSKAFEFSKIIKSIFDKESEQKQAAYNNKEAKKTAFDVDSINEKRKYITAKIEDEMDALIQDQIDVESDRLILIQGKDWNSGVIGIDADRLKEKFLRPAIILCHQSGSEYVRGSARSIPRINIYNVLDTVEQLFFESSSRPLFVSEVISNGS